MLIVKKSVVRTVRKSLLCSLGTSRVVEAGPDIGDGRQDPGQDQDEMTARTLQHRHN